MACTIERDNLIKTHHIEVEQLIMEAETCHAINRNLPDNLIPFPIEDCKNAAHSVLTLPRDSLQGW